MDRITRKELKSDTFAVEVGQTLTFFEEHKQESSGTAAPPLAWSSILLGYFWYSGRQHSKRQEALYRAIQVQETPVGPIQPGSVQRSFPTQEVKDDVAIKAFADVQSAYGSSEEGEIAAYYLASIKADQGKLAEAEKLFKEVSDRAGDKYASLAKLALAQIYFADGRSDQGEAVLKASSTSRPVRLQGTGDHPAGALHRAPQARRGQASCSIRCAPCRARSAPPRSRPTPRSRSSRTSMLARLRFPVEQSRGRSYPEPEHPYRNAFQRDRDRVVHSRAFRRLEAKTQVFTPGLSDHFRNRLTHTIEVAQIARTLARVLGSMRT